MSYVVLGTDVLEDDALVVVTSPGDGITSTYTRRAASADLERYAVEDLRLAESAVRRLAALDRHYFPPTTPFVGRLEHGRLVALQAPECMTDEGREWLAAIAEREALPLDERTQTA